MKQFAVIGLGSFGSTVARTLYEMDQEVLAIDSNPELVDDIRDDVTEAVQANPADEDVLRSLGLRNFDVVVVAIGSDIQTSVLVSLMCKEMGVPYLVARAHNALHAKVLTKMGVDKVIHPEQDMGVRIAHALVSSNILDVIELSEDYSLVEVAVPEMWADKSLKELNMRAAYGLNAIGIRREGRTQIAPAPDDVLRSGDTAIVVGSNQSIRKLEAKFGAASKPARIS